MSRAVRRSDYPGNAGGWRQSVEERLRRQFSVAATGPHEPAGVVTIREIVTTPAAVLNGFHNTDTVTATGPGNVDLVLTFVPLDGSLHVRWGGIDVPPTAWALAGNTVTILDPAGVVQSGDVFTAAYAYDPTAVAGSPVVTSLVDFEAAGWRWLQIPRTDASDYSAVGFDDSGWASAAAPFGHFTGSGILDWPDPATAWATTTRMWARRTFAATPGVECLVRLRVEQECRVYLNGLIDSYLSPGGTDTSIAFEADKVLATNVLAIQATDDTLAGGQSYFDVEVTQ